MNSLQHPKVTLQWALEGLEAAVRRLADGPAERRVRRQFHQLLLAIERDSFPVLDDLSALARADQPARSSHDRSGAEGKG